VWGLMPGAWLIGGGPWGGGSVSGCLYMDGGFLSLGYF
jgi:hypothetical protein